MSNRLLFNNNATTTIAAQVNPGDTTVQVASGTTGRFPSPAAGQVVRCMIRDTTGAFEFIDITGAPTGDTFPVTRAREGTTSTTTWTLANTPTLSIRPSKGVFEALAQLAADETITGSWSAGTFSVTSLLTVGARSAPVLPSSYGQCYLQWSSTTQLTLAPYNGDCVFINGRFYQLGTGLTVAFGALAANTTYYAYVYVVSGTTLNLELSATAPAPSGTYNGLKIRSGDGTRTLVGMVRTNASAQLFDVVVGTTPGAGIGVISYFNRRLKACRAPFSEDMSTSSGTWTELNSAYQLSLLAWAEDAIRMHVETTAHAPVAPIYSEIGVACDSTASPLAYATAYHAGGSQHKYQAASISYIATEGYHYVTALGAVSGTGRATFFAGLTAVMAEVMG